MPEDWTTTEYINMLQKLSTVLDVRSEMFTTADLETVHRYADTCSRKASVILKRRR